VGVAHLERSSRAVLGPCLDEVELTLLELEVGSERVEQVARHFFAVVCLHLLDQSERLLRHDDPVARHLALARIAGRLIHRVPAASAAPAVPLSNILHSYEYTLGVTGTLAESRGALYAVLFQPTLHFAKPWSPQEAGMWRGRRPQDGEAMSRGVRDLYAGAAAELARWAAARNLMLVDLTHTFERTPETIYSDSVHFTGERGYAMVFEEIERRELLARIAERYRAWERRAPLGPRPAIGDNGWR